MLTEKDYCDYETCVALKELGFNQYNSIRYYAGVGGVKLWDFDGEPNYKEGELIALNDLYDVPRDGNEVAAPSLYEAQKWLREEKGMLVDSMVFADNSIDADGKVVDRWIYYSCAILNTLTAEFIRSYDQSDEYDTYEEALLEGIKEAVKILKEK